MGKDHKRIKAEAGMKLVNKIDKLALLALSAPIGFVIVSLVLHYVFKAAGAGPWLLLVAGIPMAAIFGSYFASLFFQRLLKTNVSLLRLVIGAVLGYELGAGLEFLLLYLEKISFTKDLVFFSSLIVLMSGYLGALIGQRFLSEPAQAK